MDIESGDGPREPDPTLAFAEKLLSLLDTGSFTTSYKYALLLAIFDVTLERTGFDGRPPRTLSGRELGRRVFELYWPQARPYSERGVLRQSGNRGDLVGKIASLRRALNLPEHASIEDARRADADSVNALEREVVGTVMRYPIPLLQKFGSGQRAVLDPFIYEVAWDASLTVARANRDDFDDRLRLLPGAGHHLTAIVGMARPVVEREWLRYVADRNPGSVEEWQLERHLFGGQRRAPGRLAGPLRELQGGVCFYCGEGSTRWEIDHFLPWARWPDDRLDNLVLAHRRCNNDKRAALAGLGHLRRWSQRFEPGTAIDRSLDELATRLAWPRAPRRTAGAARALYLHQPPGTMLWRGRGEVERLDRSELLAVMDVSPLAAENTGPYRHDE